MIMWEFTTYWKETPEFYVQLMKRYWDHEPGNRPTAKEIKDCFTGYYFRKKRVYQIKRQEIIKSDKFLSGTKNHKHHPESFYASHLLNESIEQAESLLRSVNLLRWL